MFWIPYFPIYLPNELLKFKKFLSKKSRLKQSWFAILKKRSRYKVLNFEVDFLKTEVFQIEQNGSQATNYSVYSKQSRSLVTKKGEGGTCTYMYFSQKI